MPAAEPGDLFVEVEADAATADGESGPLDPIQRNQL
jgi:hypothetical protein